MRIDHALLQITQRRILFLGGGPAAGGGREGGREGGRGDNNHPERTWCDTCGSRSKAFAWDKKP